MCFRRLPDLPLFVELEFRDRTLGAAQPRALTVNMSSGLSTFAGGTVHGEKSTQISENDSVLV